MSENFDGFIPANPPIGGYNSPAYREAVAANQNLSVRDRSAAPVIIPKPPVGIEVPVTPPAQRRQFVDPNAFAQRRVRKAD